MSRTARIIVTDLPAAVTLTEAEMAALLGGALDWRARLGMESLELREMPAANLTATVTGGVLSVEGTEGADSILFRESGSQLSVPGASIQSGGRAAASVPLAAVTGVTVNGLGGTTSSTRPPSKCRWRPTAGTGTTG